MYMCVQMLQVPVSFIKNKGSKKKKKKIIRVLQKLNFTGSHENCENKWGEWAMSLNKK